LYYINFFPLSLLQHWKEVPFTFFSIFLQFKNNAGTCKKDYFDNCTRNLETQRLKARSPLDSLHIYTQGL